MAAGLSSEPAATWPRSGRQSDLTPRDWLDAGQSLLKRGGLKALKLRRLADELRVSTGSFYHHFPDFDAYQGRLATYFAEAQIEGLLAAVSRGAPDPIGRIRLLSALTVRHARLGRKRSARQGGGRPA